MRLSGLCVTLCLNLWLILGVMFAGVASAADWLQWGGPNRDFHLAEGTKISAWPASGPRQIWSRNLGDGYSSMVISGNLLYTMYRKSSQDIVVALDASSGKTVWETAIDAPHASGMNIEAGPGPHSTPVIVEDRLFVTTVIGHLVALDRKTGKRLWSHDLWKEYKGNLLDRGYSSSPLPYKDGLIVPVGGAGRALMAFRQKDGSVMWSKGDMENSYSSPILIRAGGKEQVVSFMAKHVMGADAATGEVLWTVGHRTMYDINAATPTWCEAAGVLVVSSGYDGGARGIQVATGATELWNHKRLRVHHTNMVCMDGVVYGSSGDFGPAPLTAVEAKTGKVLWQDRAFAKASFLLAGDTLAVVDDDGTVAVATISKQGLKVLSEAQLLRANSWTAPLVADSRLFVRDRHQIMALAVE
ncbi:MAG: PQQ-binding-like beta-propeller repeat protein [Bryobacteraceae bacterium]|nr:PQQ-binding-like beta-propeller repeat protein [Bryobacteraceae bacterium]